jgi:hypothetical protein
VSLAQGAGAVIQTRSHSLDINPGGSRTPVASCTDGTVPVSSGYSVAGFTPAKGGIVPFASLRTASGWRVTGFTVSEGASARLSTYVYCQ